MNKKAVVVGLGGVGSWVLQGLCPFLNYQNTTKKWELMVIDGDEYEPANHTRQIFSEFGPKAEVQAAWIARAFPNVRVTPIAKYISADGAKDSLAIHTVIQSGDIVFSCVDNHKTRKVIARHCGELDNAILISGGNEYTDGNVQLFVRYKKEDLTPTLDKYHPEIAKPKDKAPHEQSCEEAAVSSPQLIFANMMVASLMLNTFYAVDQKSKNMAEAEIYFDIIKNAAVPKERRK